MRPPTADEIALAQTFTGDPIALNNRATRGNRPPRPGKRPRGRPRKDGQPPHQSPEAAEKERHAAAAKVYAAKRYKTAPSKPPAPITPNSEPPAKYADCELLRRIDCLEMGDARGRARTFLRVLSNCPYKEAERAANASPLTVHHWHQNKEFADIYRQIMDAKDAATIAKTCGTLAALANGEYKPAPDCLPPDMRAASLLMPALDPRFRPSGQTAAQQVQINIQI